MELRTVDISYRDEIIDALTEDSSDLKVWHKVMTGEVLDWLNEVLKFAKDNVN